MLVPFYMFGQLTEEERRNKRAEVVAKEMGFADSDRLMEMRDSTENSIFFQHNGYHWQLNIKLYADSTFIYDSRPHFGQFKFTAGKWNRKDSIIFLKSSPALIERSRKKYPKEKFKYILLDERYLFIKNRISLKRIE